MGYHIILNHTKDRIEHHYVDLYDDLTKFEIEESSIIYQGEEHWSPVMVKDHKTYENLSKLWFRMGIQAQAVFKQQAIDHGLILEELSQDQDSFKAYTDISDKYIDIKRGDYLVRNVYNFEIDVKCRKFFKNKGGELCFEFNADHLTKHEAMMKFTCTTSIYGSTYSNQPL